MRAAEVELPLSLIDASDRLRDLNPADVDDLAVSIDETGLIHAITVRPISGDEEGATRYKLVVGGHRLAAHRKLRRPTIRSRIQLLSALDARQMEVDENLIRANLEPLDFARFVAERLEIFAERNPDQVVRNPHEGRGRGRPPKNFVTLTKTPGAYVKALMGFAEETARDVRLSPRTIYRAAQLWAGIPADLRQDLRGTPIAKNEGLLRQLAAMGDKAEQAKVAELLISGKAKGVPEGMAIAAGNTPVAAVQTPVDETLKAFRELWGKASPSAREAILNDLAGRKLPKGWAVTEVADG